MLIQYLENSWLRSYGEAHGINEQMRASVIDVTISGKDRCNYRTNTRRPQLLPNGASCNDMYIHSYKLIAFVYAELQISQTLQTDNLSESV